MSDLISRSQLLKEIETWGGCVDALHGYIQNMPTAYSVDKVVKKLEKKKEEVQRMRNTCVALSDLEVCDIENVTYERAIEIVKHGGVYDDVCQWKKHRIIDNVQMRKTSCLYEIEERLVKKYRYCPYCGKKIKVVE